MSSTRRNVTAWTAATLLVTAIAMGCGDDDDGAIGSIEEWCAQVADIDASFESTDTSSEPFDVKQEQYAAINAGLDELSASIEVVPTEARDAVAESITWASDLTDVIVGAESEEAATTLLFAEDGIYARAEPLDPAGAAWILDACGVDIDGDQSG